MITLISFIILLAGAANWLIIGLMQYDFVAGIFGTQSSMLSRLIYIIIGVAAIWMVLMVFVQKGKIKINDNGFGSLNKIAPAKNKLKEKQSHTNQDNQTQQFQNYEYSAKNENEQISTRPTNHEYAHPNTTEAGNEFYSSHSQHSQNAQNKRNPFD